ncbi:serine protease, partial [Staphylococcus aureus]|nr:serine protease [Staphylococcus aureus]
DANNGNNKNGYGVYFTPEIKNFIADQVEK